MTGASGALESVADMRMSGVVPAHRVILGAARTVIAQGGIDSLTLSAVARACAIPRPDLYALFRNKTELLLAIAAEELGEAAHCLARKSGPVPQSLPYADLVAKLAPGPADTIIPDPDPLPGPLAGLPPLADDPPDAPPFLPDSEPTPNQPTVFARRRGDSAQLHQIVDRLGFPTTPLGEGSATAVARMDRRVVMVEKIIAELQSRFDKLEKVANDGLQTTETSLEGLVQRADLTEKRLAETAKTLRGELLDAFTHVVPPPVEPPRITPSPQEPLPPNISETPPHADMPTDPPPVSPPPVSPSEVLMRAAFKRAGTTEGYLANARRSAMDGAASLEAPPMVAPRPRPRRRKHLLGRQQLLGIGAISIAVILATMGIALSEGLIGANGQPVHPALQAAAPPQTLASLAPAPSVETQPPAPETAPAQTAPDPAPAKRTLEQRLEILANGGNTKAALILGVRYLEGESGQRNTAEAARFLERAAKAGEPVAQYRLGTLYQRGVGVVRNDAQALRWYEAAANQGNRKAMHNLGVFYAEGRGTAQDFEHAAEWFLRAANMGYVDSQFDMGVLHERGAGVPQSLTEAYKWYAIAAKGGDAVSKTRIEVLSTQLEPEELATARAAALAFHPLPLGRVSNMMPQLADLRAY